MGEWVDTPYGRRFKEDYGTSIAFFMTAPDEDGKRLLPCDVIKIILEAKMVKEHEEEDEEKSSNE